MLEDANTTGMWTNCIFALCFLLQEEQKSGSDPSWWWSLLVANVEETKDDVFGDAGRARKIEKQGLHVLTTEPTAASGCISRHYIDLNCHLSGNLSHDTKTFFLFGIKLWSPYLGFGELGWHRESLLTSSTHRFISQPLPQANLLYLLCELLSKVLHKIGGKGVLILFEQPKMWTHWEFFFLRKYCFFMNFRCLWSHSDVAHLLYLFPALCPNFDRNKGVGLDYTPPGQRD